GSEDRLDECVLQRSNEKNNAVCLLLIEHQG
ncbi:unnamed protein product, partial [marine sediment metagenome]